MNKRRLSILIYHRVLDKPDNLRPGEVDVVLFNKQMRWIKRFYNVLDLSEAVERLKNNTLPARALCITFDDGYKDNHDNALPILKSHQLKATFFIATAFLNGGIMWNDVIIEAFRNTQEIVLDLQSFGAKSYDLSAKEITVLHTILSDVKYLSVSERSKLIDQFPKLLGIDNPRNLMMNDDEIKNLFAAGMGIGGHTVNHPILSTLNSNEAKIDILNGKEYLQQLLEENVNLFAYPNGKPEQDYTKVHAELMKEEGFQSAVTTAWGAATEESDEYQLPRFTPWDQNVGKFLLRLWLMRFSAKEQIAI